MAAACFWNKGCNGLDGSLWVRQVSGSPEQFAPTFSIFICCWEEREKEEGKNEKKSLRCELLSCAMSGRCIVPSFQSHCTAAIVENSMTEVGQCKVRQFHWHLNEKEKKETIFLLQARMHCHSSLIAKDIFRLN